MKPDLATLKRLLKTDAGADRVVPPAGFTVRLTLFTAAAMASRSGPRSARQGTVTGSPPAKRTISK